MHRAASSGSGSSVWNQDQSGDTPSATFPFHRCSDYSTKSLPYGLTKPVETAPGLYCMTLSYLGPSPNATTCYDILSTSGATRLTIGVGESSWHQTILTVPYMRLRPLTLPFPHYLPHCPQNPTASLISTPRLDSMSTVLSRPLMFNGSPSPPDLQSRRTTSPSLHRLLEHGYEHGCGDNFFITPSMVET